MSKFQKKIWEILYEMYEMMGIFIMNHLLIIHSEDTPFISIKQSLSVF